MKYIKFNRNIYILKFLFVFVFLFTLVPSFALAETNCSDITISSSISDLKNCKFGLNTTAKGIFNTSGSADLATITGNIVGVALSLLGVAFMILIVYAGFLWMQARGNEDEAKKAKEIMINAVIGAIIVFSAYVITNYIIESLYTSITIVTTTS